MPASPHCSPKPVEVSGRKAVKASSLQTRRPTQGSKNAWFLPWASQRPSWNCPARLWLECRVPAWRALGGCPLSVQTRARLLPGVLACSQPLAPTGRTSPALLSPPQSLPCSRLAAGKAGLNDSDQPLLRHRGWKRSLRSKESDVLSWCASASPQSSLFCPTLYLTHFSTPGIDDHFSLHRSLVSVLQPCC